MNTHLSPMVWQLAVNGTNSHILLPMIDFIYSSMAFLQETSTSSSSTLADSSAIKKQRPLSSLICSLSSYTSLTRRLCHGTESVWVSSCVDSDTYNVWLIVVVCGSTPGVTSFGVAARGEASSTMLVSFGGVGHNEGGYFRCFGSAWIFLVWGSTFLKLDIPYHI